jgi:zinc transporter
LPTKLTARMTQTMYTLSLVATLFLPLGFLTGLLGINVSGIPGSDHPLGFLAVCLLIVIVVTLEILFFRTRKWF